MNRETEDFFSFVTSMKSLAQSVRREIHLEEVPAPQKLAPHAYAIAADVATEIDDDESDIATGRFVILHDPQGQEAWDGHFRCVTFIRSAIDDEMQGDPLLPEVGWSWFIESLDKCGAEYTSPSGTVTRVSSASFGQLSTTEETSEIEIRASWTPKSSHELINHAQAWIDLLAIVSGLNPIPEGVRSLPTRR